MSPPTGDPATSALDTLVYQAFGAWDRCHLAIASLRQGYDDALHLHETQGAPDPVGLRTQMHATQKECDGLFFRFLKLAEQRTQVRYI